MGGLKMSHRRSGLALLADLQRRCLMEQCTQAEQLADHLNEARTIYCGFDPTADSLHIGSLVPLLAMRRMQLFGHRPLLLIGGGTGLIGDPSGKSQERTLNEADIVAAWSERLRAQVSRFVDFDDPDHGAIMANNYDWLHGWDILSFMRDIGKHFSVNTLMTRESVKARLAREETGISYTEFSYGILQALDFYTLHRDHGCTVQIGGSDQWGNIVAGIDLGRRLAQAHLFGLTLPLMVKADGSKFGKTEAGTIWLDANKTSPYAFYQFWINQADADVDRLLRFFTFIDCDEIDGLMNEHRQHPERRLAQKALAEAVTTIVHGEEGLVMASRVTTALFAGSVRDLTRQDLDCLRRDGLSQAAVTGEEIDLVSALIDAGLAPSRRQAREWIAQGALTVNGERTTEVATVLRRSEALHGAYHLLRRGKKNDALIVWSSSIDA